MHPSSFSLNLNLQAGPQRWKGALFDLYTPLPSAFHNDFDSLQKDATWVAGSSWDLGSPTLPCVPTVLSLVPSAPEWEWEASVPSHPLFMELRCLHIECPQTALCGWLKASRRLLRPWFFFSKMQLEGWQRVRSLTGSLLTFLHSRTKREACGNSNENSLKAHLPLPTMGFCGACMGTLPRTFLFHCGMPGLPTLCRSNTLFLQFLSTSCPYL